MEHDDGDGEGEGEGVRVDHRGGAAFSLDRLDRDADRQRNKKAGLGQRCYRLYLGVAERVIGISGLVGLAHGKKGAPFAPEGRSALRGYDFSTDRE
jgi:hypothetical protein